MAVMLRVHIDFFYKSGSAPKLVKNRERNRGEKVYVVGTTFTAECDGLTIQIIPATDWLLGK